MRYGIGAAISLADITGGILGTGAVPLDRITRFKALQRTAGAVVPVGGIDILNINVGACYTNERAVFNFHVKGTKGGVAGVVRLYFEDDASVCDWDVGFGNKTSIRQDQEGIQNGSTHWANMTVFLTVGSAGNLAVKLRGFSAGSDFTIANLEATVMYWVYRQT